MSSLRRLRNFWIACVTTIVLGCFSDAVAQTSYKVTDLGTLNDDNFSCAMAVNDHGWTENMDGSRVAYGLALLVKGIRSPYPGMRA